MFTEARYDDHPEFMPGGADHTPAPVPDVDFDSAGSPAEDIGAGDAEAVITAPDDYTMAGDPDAISPALVSGAPERAETPDVHGPAESGEPDSDSEAGPAGDSGAQDTGGEGSAATPAPDAEGDEPQVATGGGGDDRGPRFPRNPILGSGSPEGEGGLLPASDPIFSGVNMLRQNTVRDLAFGTVSKDQILERLETDRYLGAAYPDRQVPDEFIRDNPNVRFTPVRLDESGILNTAGPEMGEEILAYAQVNGLDQAIITKPEQLAGWMAEMQRGLGGRGYPLEAIKALLDDAFADYAQNLELHRLTQDPNGEVTRFSRTPILDDPHRDPPRRGDSTVQYREDTFRPYLHPTLREEMRGSLVTSWFRGPISLSERDRLGSILGGDTLQTTVGQLSQQHVLALDHGAPSSLIAFRKLR